MALWSIPLPDETEPSVTQSVSLSGRSYVFTIDWNSRTDRWTVGLADEDANEIINGAILCTGIDLLRTVPATLDYVPPGSLWLSGIDDPVYGTMNSVILYYYTEDA